MSFTQNSGCISKNDIVQGSGELPMLRKIISKDLGEKNGF